MEQRLLFDEARLRVTILRLCHEVAERHNGLHETVILGLQPRGVYFAERIQQGLAQVFEENVPLGKLDVTFHRDDFRRGKPLAANTTDVPFLIENKRVLLIDDVLYSGRTIRAALSAMEAFGRPQEIELLTLVDRKYRRELPVQPQYTGVSVNTLDTQRIRVQWKEQGHEADTIWLVEAPFEG